MAEGQYLGENAVFKTMCYPILEVITVCDC